MPTRCFATQRAQFPERLRVLWFFQVRKEEPNGANSEVADNKENDSGRNRRRGENLQCRQRKSRQTEPFQSYRCG